MLSNSLIRNINLYITLGTSEDVIAIKTNTVPVLINGSVSFDLDSGGTAFNPQARQNPDDMEKLNIGIKMSELKEAGISPQDIKTVQVTLVCMNFSEKVLAESTVVYNIKLT